MWFWSTPQWARYCAAYGGPVTDNSHPDNIVIPLGPKDQMLASMRYDHRTTIRRMGAINRLGSPYLAVWEPRRIGFDAYQRLHEKDAGRKTRPQETFDIMYDFIGQGFGQLLLIHRADSAWYFEPDKTVLGASYFYVYQDGAYWGSSARLPGGPKDIGCAMIWEAMTTLAAWGYRYLDLGHEENARIGEFKRGFYKGGAQSGAAERLGESLSSPSAA